MCFFKTVWTHFRLIISNCSSQQFNTGNLWHHSIYIMSNNELNELVAILNDKQLTIAFAESVTAGYVGCQFSKALNISEVYKGSVVAYQETIKTQLLGVSQSTLDTYTAESQEVTNEMAVGIKKLYDVDIAVAITGLANPGGSESPSKPVGTVFITIIHANQQHKFQTVFSGSREEIIAKSTQTIFEHLKKIITS